MTALDPNVWTIVVAAGSSSRFGADKLSVALRGEDTVLDLSVKAAGQFSAGTVVVLHPNEPMLVAQPQADLIFVAGGASRSESVRNGLAAVPPEATVVLVHDGARPLAGGELYQRVIDAVVEGAVAVVPVVPVVDTVRSIDGGVVDRERLRAVQTPQGFNADILRAAHHDQPDATDDAALVEALGHSVVLVDGDIRNIKITRAADIQVARALLEPGD